MSRIGTLLKTARQMGPRYTAYRVRHAAETKLGVLRRRFPAAPGAPAGLCPLEAFRQNTPAFFFAPGEVAVARRPDAALAARADAIAAGTLPYFSAESYALADVAPWRTHPVTGAIYPDVHWSRVPDLDPELGDIKYIWEPSRFSHLYTLIRDEHHNGTDRGAVVLGQIADWLADNPANVGPNYKCSQEISLRVLNWTFALHYYRDHAALTEELWRAVQANVYWSLHHVRHHIDFSRIAVRNNHAITETTALWLGGLLYPWLPDVGTWSRSGKAWLEEELLYQIYPDGTYLQHSHNYQRVVTQLLSWGVRLGALHDDPLSASCLARAAASLRYLQAMSQADGRLPNYGANDGALFFPLAEQDYLDYRPQLDALARALGVATLPGGDLEEGDWLGLPPASDTAAVADGTLAFPDGGIYALRQDRFFAFVKAQSYRDRPSQSDNLHLDVWIDGENVLRDQGTFRYNAGEADRRYFFGTASHNAVTVGGLDQMTKGPRFIWLDWTRAASGAWTDEATFEGSIDGFAPLGHLRHHRSVEFDLGNRRLTVRDFVENKPAGAELRQLWHPHPEWLPRLTFAAVDGGGHAVTPRTSEGYHSGYYGVKAPVTDVAFVTDSPLLITDISWA